MIKAVVLDVDGVIVGSKHGVNFPYPGNKVAKALRKIHNDGVQVSFLTGKSSYTLGKMVEKLGIDSLHIGDAGATLFNPIRKQVLHTDRLPRGPLQKILKELDKASIYVNVFTQGDYYIGKEYLSPFTDLYSKVADRSPVTVDDISDTAHKNIPKVNIVAQNEADVRVVEDILLKNMSRDIHAGPWSLHPALGLMKLRVLTKSGVSKYSGLKHLTKQLSLNLKEVLGVGDTMHDWEFIEHCGYKGIMGNATEELKENADFSDPKTYLGGHVDKDGILDVLNYFGL